MRRRYYIVVSRRASTISWVMAILVSLVPAHGSGQSAVTRGEPDPAPLLPVDVAWQATLPAPAASGAALDALRVYVPVGSTRTAAFDRETGARVWMRHIGTAWPPVAADDRVFLASPHDVHAVSASTGGRLWRHPLPAGALAPMAYSGGVLLVLAAPDEVWAIRGADGRLMWRRQLTGSPGPATVTAVGGTAYLTRADHITRLSIDDGAIVWARQLTGVLTSPAVSRGVVVVGSSDRTFRALDADSGSIAWTFPVGGGASGVAADADRLYLVSLDNTLRVVNRGNGNQQWRKVLPARPIGSPTAFGGVVMVVTGSSATLTAFAARTGSQVGTYDPLGSLSGPALVDPALRPFAVSLVLTLDDGRILALRPVGRLYKEQSAVPLDVLPGRALPREPAPR